MPGLMTPDDLASLLLSVVVFSSSTTLLTWVLADTAKAGATWLLRRSRSRFAAIMLGNSTRFVTRGDHRA